MKKSKKILLLIILFAIVIILKSNKVQAAQYIWPIGGYNANETYVDYEYYGQRYTAPYKNGKSGREYRVNVSKWPDELYYYASCESHFGMDITGIYGNTYQVVSVVNGTVIATSGTAIYNPSVNYIDRNQRATYQGLYDGGGYGNYIIIQEDNTGRCFLYGHLKGGSFKVSQGSRVTAGQEIATMGSSGDSGHMHLHFEIRKSKDCTIVQYNNGSHYLVSTTSYTNLDPADYIGTTPNVHTPVNDEKTINVSKDEMKLYVDYLYRTVLLRSARDNEKEYWANKYIETGSVATITRAIFLSDEANRKLGNLSNLDFSKKAYEIILYRGNKYTEQEMSGHVDKLNRGIWTRTDYITRLTNSTEFSEYKFKAIVNDMSSVIDTESITPSKEDVELYTIYLYRTVLLRQARKTESEAWANKYEEHEKSIADIATGIILSKEASLRMGELSNTEFIKKVYEIMYAGNVQYTEDELNNYVDKLNRGIWTRREFITKIANSGQYRAGLFNTIVSNERKMNCKVKGLASPEKLTRLGDLNGDGLITIQDASVCLNLIERFKNIDKNGDECEYAIEFADVNQDGVLDNEDASLLLEYYANQSVGVNFSFEDFLKIKVNK